MTPAVYMRPPEEELKFTVGDHVEVNCDHEKNNQRIRGWLKGTIVQVDDKMVAVQFKTNIYLTDGWMVPDHILWFPYDSIHVRSMKKNASRRMDY